MKLADHTDKIRRLIDKSFRNQLGRMGISEKAVAPIESIPYEYHEDRKRIETIFDTLIEETNHNRKDAYEKLVEEFTFTLFNRLAALKVMEAHTLHAEIVTRQTMHGGRSFAHLAWLEENSDQRSAEQEGLVKFLEDELNKLSNEINLFSLDYPYHLLPTPIETNQIIEAFNAVETDKDVETNIWQSDDVMGWLYESYNNYKKLAHKESKAKTEYNKVAIQSQVYTPRWVVKFLVDNSLGKLYLEMFPHSEIKDKYQIANAPREQTRTPKALTEIKLIDPACGSANFLLYGFDLFYDLYLDQIENYGADFDERQIPELILRHNLHGIDLDDRAIQIAQLGLYIKAKRRRRSAKIEHFNIVSSDFFLPDYSEVKELFETDAPLDENLEKIISELWSDLQQAHKFGALIQLEEKFNAQLENLIAEAKGFSLPGMYEEKLEDYYKFRPRFFGQLQKAVAQHNKKFGSSFLSVKTADAITFLELLTQKYDVAVANPPYTDSSDFGAELKTFIETNYKKPYKFNTNLYATFIKRCCDIVDEKGKVALVHPPTFMYIKTFEDVRNYIVNKVHINLFVEWGYLGMFNPTARVDSAMYILEKETKKTKTQFIKLNDIYEGKRYDAFFQAYDDLLNGRPNKHNYAIDQSKLKIIEGSPFIYWISNEFRQKFEEDTLVDHVDAVQGLATADNERFLRYFWELDKSNITNSEDESIKKWVPYQKGGPFEKWYGNNWTVVNWGNNGFEIKNFTDSNGKQRSRPQNERFYFCCGITYPQSGTKGASFRYVERNNIFDVSGSCIFTDDDIDVYFLLAYLNSKFIFYILDCLNPTVHVQTGDINRVPFVKPSADIENKVARLSAQNVEIKKYLCSYRVFEPNFAQNPISASTEQSIQEKLSNYLSYENSNLTLVLVNEAIINRLILEMYSLSCEDHEQVEAKMGKPVGELPVLADAARDFGLGISDFGLEEDLSFVGDFIRDLPSAEFDAEKIQTIKAEFATLYQSNNDLEEFCIRHQVNPINVWYWFKQSSVIPAGRGQEIALEFLADVVRAVLMEDEDGIVPLVSLPGEPALLDRLEQKCLSLGFTSAQFAQLDNLLGRSVKDYLEHHFFGKLSDHLNLFMYLPKTPFIWHLSSGEQQGFEAYIIIYKWTRDSLYKLKSTYITRREESLNYRLSQLAESQTAQAQTEKELIRLQLQEITDFTRKIDELIAESYNPTLDDGVGKNIAPLQKKGMLRADVLNAKQLEKYLNADW